MCIYQFFIISYAANDSSLIVISPCVDTASYTVQGLKKGVITAHLGSDKRKVGSDKMLSLPMHCM